jgi:uncharacterized membrane protein (Fun14 family)
MSELISPLVYQLGAGGVLGFIVGYAVKKVVKILIVIAGLLTLGLLLLEYQGIINVNYDKLLELVGSYTGGLGESVSWLNPILAYLPFAGSFALGAVVGLKAG